MIKAIIFDLDDTLISEKDYIISGFNHVARILSDKTGISQNNIVSDLVNLFDTSSKYVLNRFFEKNNIEYTDELIKELISEYRSHLPNVKFYDDVLPFLKEVKNLGIKTGIISDGYEIAQKQKLKVIEADKYFDAIILTCELGNEYWKPHPKAFELISKKLNVAFEEMIYVGDNPEKDFYIGKLYPIITVRINRNGIYRSKDYIENIKEKYSIDSLYELTDIISKSIT